MSEYANHFYEIEEIITTNTNVQEQAIKLAGTEPIKGKSTEGGTRVEDLREILISFFSGDLSYEEAAERIVQDLPQRESPHAHDNNVFSSDWNERLARTQISRFYNKAVMLELQESGDSECYIPHSDHEMHDSKCTKRLAGSSAEIETLLDRLDTKYKEGNWDAGLTIPSRPNCTHTVKPASE